MQVSRVFTTGISRNKEIHLNVLIEDDSNNFGSSSIGFLPSPRLSENSNIPQCESRIHFRPCIGVRSILVSRGFFGQSAPLTRLQPISGVCGKTLCAGTTQAATHIGEEIFIDRNHTGSGKARSAQVLRNSPRAMPLPDHELVRPELTCDEFPLTIDV